eukprot:jgi/Mesvir1/26903/Mv20631-RA.1
MVSSRRSNPEWGSSWARTAKYVCDHEAKHACKLCGIGQCEYIRNDACPHGFAKPCPECALWRCRKHTASQRKVAKPCSECILEGCELHPQIHRDECIVCNPETVVFEHLFLCATKRLGVFSKDEVREALGIDMPGLIRHLEDRFEGGMAWETYGKEWYIDHMYTERGPSQSLEETLKKLHHRNVYPTWRRTRAPRSEEEILKRKRRPRKFVEERQVLEKPRRKRARVAFPVPASGPATMAIG